MLYSASRTPQNGRKMHKYEKTLTIAFLTCILEGSKDSFVEAFSRRDGRRVGLSSHWSSENALFPNPRIEKCSFDNTYRTCGDVFPLFSSVYDEVKDENLPWKTSDEGDFSASWLGATKTQSTSLKASAIIPILQAAFLVTGNTVGAGMMVLPEVAGDAGLALTVPMVLGLYTINLVSGLLINEVAIKQYESIVFNRKTAVKHDVVPSSLKHLSDATIGDRAGTFISGISVLVNWCVLSFALMRSGEVLHGSGLSIPGISFDDANLTSVLCALLLATGMVRSSDGALSIISTVAVTVLFGSFAGLLVPGLAQMQNPVATFMTPPTHAGTVVDAFASAAPIFLMAMIYQNVVPNVTKLLNYDRIQTTSAIAIGSAIPSIMYIAWCFAALGGGVDSSVQTGGPLLTLFSMASIVGSSVGSAMSTSEEIGSIFKKVFGNVSSGSGDEIRTLPSVLLSVFPPLLAGIFFSQGEAFTSALSCAGSYGSPLLYGVLPAVLLGRQLEKEKGDSGNNEMFRSGVFGAISLGVLSLGFIVQELVVDITPVCA